MGPSIDRKAETNFRDPWSLEIDRNREEQGRKLRERSSSTLKNVNEGND